MIKTLEQVPYVYGKESRDFQLLARLFDLSFNTSKVAIDSMLNNNGSENIDYRFVDLACRTVGFEYHGSYDTRELIAVVKSFKDIMRGKGTRDSIYKAIILLLNSQYINSGFYADWHNKDKYVIFSLPESVKHTRLLDEIFEYILPAGWTYSIVLKSVIQIDPSITSDKIIVLNNLRTINLSDKETDVANYYISGSGLIDLTYIGQVPDNNTDFISPVVNFETVISDIPAEERN